MLCIDLIFICRIVKKNRERKLKEKEKKGPVSGAVPGAKVAAQNLTDRRNLHNYRVVQRNLIYVVGIPGTMASEELLRKPEYFGQYGKIGKIVIHRNQSASQTTVSAYITFVHKDDAKAAIQSLDGFWSDGHLIRASFGTTKYCNNFIRGVSCSNPDCVYLHDLGDDDDRFTKEEIQAGQSKLVPTPGQNQALVTGNGGPSGTGKRPTGEPVFPPPVFIQDVGASRQSTVTHSGGGGVTPAKEKVLTWANGNADHALTSHSFDADDTLPADMSFSESTDHLPNLANIVKGGASLSRTPSTVMLSPARSPAKQTSAADKTNGRVSNSASTNASATAPAPLVTDRKTQILATTTASTTAKSGTTSADVSASATSKLLAVLNGAKEKESVLVMPSVTSNGATQSNGVSKGSNAADSTGAPSAVPTDSQKPVSKPENTSITSDGFATVATSQSPGNQSAAVLNALHMNVSMNRLDPLKEPQLFAAFNGVARSMVFPVPVSTYTCTVWSTILSKCSTDLHTDPFCRTTFPVSEFLDLTLPPVDAMCAPPWPKPNSYYRRGLEAGLLAGSGIVLSPAQRQVMPSSQIPGFSLSFGGGDATLAHAQQLPPLHPQQMLPPQQQQQMMRLGPNRQQPT